MNPENFETKFAAHDPAKNLDPSSDNQRDALIARATSATSPRVIRPINRKALLAGAAAVAAFAIAIPAGLSSSNTPDAPFISLGAANAGTAEGAMKTAGDSRFSLAANDQAVMYGNLNHYIFDAADLNNPFGQLHSAYSVVEVANFENRVQNIIDALGIDGVTRQTEGENVWWTNTSENSKPNVASVYIYGGTNAGWSYYNPTLDSFQCTDATSSDGVSVTSDCEPRFPVNLPSESEAIAKAKDWIAKIGLDTSGDWRWTAETAPAQSGSQTFDAYVSATAQLYVDGIAAPISMSLSFADNGELFAAWGSLQELRILGNYKIASPEAVLNRANEATAKSLAKMKEDLAKQTPAPAASDGQVTEEPGINSWTPTANEVVVKSVQVAMTVVYDKNGNQLWIPAYQITGYLKGISDSPVGSVATEIAVDSSQIDLSEFYSPMAMYAKDAVAY
ncbi:MAG: hypothetical protein RIS43_115 [Actinomycetota bacterium]|jgi:hypothetical protein